MVIFPIADERTSAESVSVWPAIEGRLKQNASAYWLVTQPSHAALAGDFAAALREDLFGPIDQTVARSIALHDAGWSMEDAEQIQRLRSDPKQKPSSFLDADTDQFLRAWTASIETAQRFAAVGGYLVSRHFDRLSLHGEQKGKSKLEAFRKREKERQQMLRTGINHEQPALERLVAVPRRRSNSRDRRLQSAGGATSTGFSHRHFPASGSSAFLLFAILF